ncbi:unnamed protein product [Trichobilharzia szidati]|nr:unnamed protein product [Trichobilharzia szidati]
MSCCTFQTSYTNGGSLGSSHEFEQFKNDFIVENEIGRGRFAKVSLVRHRLSGELSAAKMIRRWRCGKDTMESIMQEIEVVMTSHHNPYIVKMKDYYVGDKEVVLLLENCSQGDLYHYVHYNEESLEESIVVEASRQLIKAVSFLHSQSIVHLDIKPENILLRHPFPQCEIALCDFGLAKYLKKNEIIRDLVGTPDYAAPEILNYDPIHFTTDMWSVGVVVYYLLTSESPFWNESKEQTFLNVCQLKISYDEHLFQDITPQAISFIKRLIQKDPRDRPSAVDCLEDPWFNHVKPMLTQIDTSNNDNIIQNGSHDVSTRPDSSRSFGE